MVDASVAIPSYIADLSVLHIGAGRYELADRMHSTFSIWRELAKGFRRYTVFARSKSTTTKIVEGNLTVHLLKSCLAKETEFFWMQRRAVRLADIVAADVVVAQSPVFGGIAGVLIKRRRSCGLLVELHSDDFVTAQVGIKQRLIQLMTGPVLGRADRIRTLANRMADDVITKYGNQLADRVVVLPPRVDLALFKPKTHCSDHEARLRLAIIGSVGPRKRQFEFLSTVLRSGIDIETWIVGDGPDMGTCREIVAQYAAQDRVRFFGQVAQEQLANLLREVDALVMYSRSEGTPRAIMEAMAVGLPIVTTNAGYCSDIVTHGVEGFVLGANPDAEIVPVLECLRRNHDLRQRMGAAARARAEREFDAEMLYSRYRALISETARA